MAHERGLKNSLCLLPLRSEEHGFSDWGRFCSPSYVDIFGTTLTGILLTQNQSNM